MKIKLFTSCVSAFLLVSGLIVNAQDAKFTSEDLFKQAQSFNERLQTAAKSNKFETIGQLWNEFKALIANEKYSSSDVRTIFVSQATWNSLDPRNKDNRGYLNGLSSTATDNLNKAVDSYHKRFAAKWADEQKKQSFKKLLLNIFDAFADFIKSAEKKELRSLNDWKTKPELAGKIGRCYEGKTQINMSTFAADGANDYITAEEANKRLADACKKIKYEWQKP